MPTNPMTPEAVDYAWRQLLVRAGLQRSDLTSSLLYGEPNARHPAIVVSRSRAEDWDALLALPPNQLRWIPARETVPSGVSLPFDRPVPVLFWGGEIVGTKPFAERAADGQVIVHADIIAATVFMLSRWEEMATPMRDGHGRFPAYASVASRQGFLDQPVVDEYALILAEWLRVLEPSVPRTSLRFTVKLSHDIDRVSAFVNTYWSARTLAGDIVKRRNLRLARKTLAQSVQRVLAPKRTPHFRAIGQLAAISQKYRMSSAFYFMASEPAQQDNDYRVGSPLITDCIRNLRDQGMEIGIHPSYLTFDDYRRFEEEKSRLDAVLGENQYGGRQHYLRFQAPRTWRTWEQARLVYDSTMSYADHEGFRCGTCHPYRPFDVEQNHELSLWEYPLIVMDATLLNYRHLTLEQVEKRILDLAQRCKQVAGIFTLLWHNDSQGIDWDVWLEAYRRIVGKLSAMVEGHD